ncbi:MAG: lipopolysaccharide biosynthesis protein [Syntrophaceae bacterium]|nr:lipopolysaccharide biosynthesis protein [Syntrophaceae bacterium]
MGNLQRKVTKAVMWSFLDRIGQQGVQFLVAIVLARLLMPSDIGIIGLLSIFMALAQSFIESGFSQALIQKGTTDHLDECSVFYFNVLMGCIVVVILWVGAPFIAEFFETPVLIPITRVLSFNVLINAFGLIQTALLTKELDFRTQVKAGFTAALMSGVIGIGMAYQGFGVWSLVAQSISFNVLKNGLLWWLSHWRPAPMFSWTALKTMFGFGSRLLVSGIIDTVFKQIYNPVIGKLFSPAALGYYTLATRIALLPSDSLTSIVSRVTFPAFSSIREDKQRLKGSMGKTLRLMMIINVPILVGLALVAENLVRVVLTEKWLPTVPYLQLYCIVALLLPFHYTNLNALLALGRSDLNLRLEIIKKSLIAAFISIAWRWGVTGLIISQVLISLISLYLNSYYVGKLIHYPMTEQLWDVMPSFGLGAMMAIFVSMLNCIDFHHTVVFLTCQVVVGAISFVLLGLLFRVSTFSEFLIIMKSIKS